MSDLAEGRLRVVDLTQPLGPETPVIALPPIFAHSPGVSIEVDLAATTSAARPGTGTRSRSASTPARTSTRRSTGSPARICPTTRLRHDPGRQVRRPGLRDRRVSAKSAADPDFLLTPERIEAWEAEHGRIPAGAWVLLRTDW